jgi:hypothetical protein
MSGEYSSFLPSYSLLIFGAIGMVAYSISANIRSKQPLGKMGKNLADTLLYSRGFGFLIFALVNFVGILSIFTGIIIKINTGLDPIDAIPFFIFYIAVWWIFFIAIIDAKRKI